MSNLNYYNVQKAIYEKLVASSTLMAAVSGVFDHVSQDTAFPFVIINDARAANISNLAKNGIEHRIRINIFSREAGKKQAATIMGIIEEILHNSGLSVSGQSLVSMEFIDSSIELENDGWTYRGTMDLRVIIFSN
jgi:hypothetical protein